MTGEPPVKVALLYPGDRATRDRADPAARSFVALVKALAAAGVRVEPAKHHDDDAEQHGVRPGQVDAVG